MTRRFSPTAVSHLPAGARRRLLLVALVVGCCGALARPAIAQQVRVIPRNTITNLVAVLDRGPFAELGLRFLPPNRIPYQRAVYRFRDHNVEVFVVAVADPAVVERRVPLPDPQWAPNSCAARPQLRSFDWDGRVFWFADIGELLVFIAFPPAIVLSCEFITPFLALFEFFYAALPSDPLYPFPAFVGDTG